ncbi:asparaginyl-tRNA synthetase [Daedalea quercina L-15889]|uniref:Asparagine--tRNA ligase, mitochondrial n=1 Tax=Daedalea quercina L-15889 TaxID=1314783 RepID=A0A165KW85_9APHY|nr:asparaginyl-tRNA synthetase [Daedalea quercina L-15889]
MLGRVASGSILPPTIRQLLSGSATDVRVKVNGWVQSVRRQKNVTFAVISDGSSTQGLQAVIRDGSLAEVLTNGASVSLGGTLTHSLGKGQDKELRVEEVQVVGECDPATYPIQKQALTMEYLRDNCHFRARTSRISEMLRLRATSSDAFQKFFNSLGFCYVHTPIVTSSDCEGAGETFRVISAISDLSSEKDTDKPSEFFGHPAYLTVSSQLHLEALATALSRVYTLSPCFRAERSQTSRHLSEFWMLEAEWAFTQTVNDVCSVVEAAVKDGITKTQAHSRTFAEGPSSPRILEYLHTASSTAPWTRLSYTDAVSELSKYQASARKFQFEPAWGKPLQSEHERWLAEELVKAPVFVTDYPASLKPFYMRLNDDDKTVACFDLLVPHLGELAGGSLREERSELLNNALERQELDKAQYGWYTELRKYGGAPHGGFGLGFERFISWISGVENVRECIAVPRWAGRMLL